VGHEDLERSQLLHVWQVSVGVHQPAVPPMAKLACQVNPERLETVIVAKVMLPRPQTVESV
jgi:hypothetical protein